MKGGVLLFAAEVVLPVLIGTLFAEVWRKKAGRGLAVFLLWSWVCGQVLLWGVFQALAVPEILLEREFSELCRAMLAACGLLALAALAHLIARLREERFRREWFGDRGARSAVSAGGNPGRERTLWVIFWALLALQLVLCFAMTYNDGDDAFYIAIAAHARESGRMYQTSPYTGLGADFDRRHGIAPFPMWIAFLSRLSGVSVAAVAHSFFAAEMIGLAYAVLALTGCALLGGRGEETRAERLPLFLVFAEVLVLFGDYSIHSPENFLIARSRQGKAALASFVLPLMILLLYQLAGTLSERAGYWILFLALMATGCLCSTQGAVLCAGGAMLGGICIAVSGREWKILPAIALACLPCAASVLLYWKLG